MELNELPTNHEHATVSLKAILLVFVIVLVGALAYFVLVQNNNPGTSDDLKSTGDKEIIDTSNWKVYTNSKQGWQISHPQSWPIDESDPAVTSIGDVPDEPASGAVFITLEKSKTPAEVFSTAKANRPDGCKQPNKININQIEATRFSCVEPFAGGTEIYYIFQSSADSFVLKYIKSQKAPPTNPELDITLNKTFEAIIETFKKL